jgi:hypothetical protein
MIPFGSSSVNARVRGDPVTLENWPAGPLPAMAGQAWKICESVAAARSMSGEAMSR